MRRGSPHFSPYRSYNTKEADIMRKLIFRLCPDLGRLYFVLMLILLMLIYSTIPVFAVEDMWTALYLSGVISQTRSQSGSERVWMKYLINRPTNALYGAATKTGNYSPTSI